LPLNAATITEGTLSDARLSTNIVRKNVANEEVTSALTVRGGLGIADLQLFDVSRNRLWRLLSYLDEFKAWEGNNDNFSVNINGQTRTRAGYFEFGRGQAQGQRVTWATSILTATGVNCGGSITAFYSLVGYQLWWSIYGVNMSVPVVTPYLLLPIPAGYPSVSPYTDQPIIRAFVPGIGDEAGYAQIDPNYIQIYRPKAVNWPTGIGHVIGQGFYWIG